MIVSLVINFINYKVMTEQEKLLREAIRKEIKKNLNELGPRSRGTQQKPTRATAGSVKKSMGIGKAAVGGGLASKLALALNSIDANDKQKIQRAGLTQKALLAGFFLKDFMGMDEKSFTKLYVKIKGVLD